MKGLCKFCGQQKDLREGGCWDCANAESIISDGTDMWDKGIGSDGKATFQGEKGKPAKYPGEKLKLLIERGWTCLTNFEK